MVYFSQDDRKYKEAKHLQKEYKRVEGCTPRDQGVSAACYFTINVRALEPHKPGFALPEAAIEHF